MLARWSRVDVSVAALVRETCVSGVSTRKAGRVAEKLGISSLSSSEVSRLCQEPGLEVEALRSRDLSRMPCCYLWLDATYMSRGEDSVVSSHAVVTAIGAQAANGRHSVRRGALFAEPHPFWDYWEGAACGGRRVPLPARGHIGAGLTAALLTWQ